MPVAGMARAPAFANFAGIKLRQMHEAKILAAKA